MKLVIPYFHKLQAADAKLVRLAEFLGIACETLSLANTVGRFPEYLESAAADRQACFVVNPSVMKEWVGGDTFPLELSSFLPAHFRQVLVHAVRPESFDKGLVFALSAGQLSGLQGIQHPGSPYEISPESRDICEAFAGLSFGPVNLKNDRVFTGQDGPHTRKLISIGGDAFMASVTRGQCEILFAGSEDVADLEVEANGEWLTEYFSRFLPHAMALRHFFGEECWRPAEQHASVVVDDPLLRRNYGFLNFECLLGLMKQHNFQTTIAFIPHNFRRSSPRISKMFRENANRLALCFHGNDHTGAEFAVTDRVLLNTMLHTAERRMKQHSETTGLHCDRVMVFPQGQFSIEAMVALKSRNFDAAVNTVPHPREQQVSLTLAELAQPAVLRYSGFPLFLRKNSLRTQSIDIAFNLFFGRPILIVEHHNIFEDPQSLIDAVSRINAAAPEIHWSNLGTAVSNSILRRREHDGTYRVKAYSRTVRVSNSSESRKQFSIEWNHPGPGMLVEGALRKGAPCSSFAFEEAGVRIEANVDPGDSEMFSVTYRGNDNPISKFGLRHSTRAFVRRRLSELRDNYLSKNPSILAAAKTLQRRFQH